MQVTHSQYEAITHGEGPAMVLAGPGSGKTLVITSRTRHLIESAGISPRNILVITFTKAAALEMQERFFRMSGVRGVTFGTFHAVFFTILRNAYGYTAANILREEQKSRILSELLRHTSLSGEDEKESITDVAAEISMVKNAGIALEHYYSVTMPEDEFRRVFREYERIHKQQNLLDFDDMLVYCHDLLKERPDILGFWQKQFRYILVDEFQDINFLQYEIIRMLALPDNNLFIVGDDDQSIYRFRGARPEIMLQFPRDYPQGKVISLEHNFRCSRQILEASLRVIEENEHRYAKRLQSVKKEGSGVDLRTFSNQDQECNYLLACLKRRGQQGLPAREAAILFRTNQAVRPFAEKLMENNIPFSMRDRLPNLYEHWIARDLYAYFHLALEGMDRKEFLQVMNRPVRYIQRDAILSSKVSFKELRAYYKDKDWMLERLTDLRAELEILAGLRPFAAINYIRHGIGYEDYVKEYAVQHHLDEEELIQTLDELQDSAREFATYQEWKDHIAAYQKTLQQEQNNFAGRKRSFPGNADSGHLDGDRADRVTLATLHSAKGLEFDEVFIVNINDGILPHKKAATQADLEEERRLLYVGMTRARTRLHLFSVKEWYGHEMEPSEFLEVLE